MDELENEFEEWPVVCLTNTDPGMPRQENVYCIFDLDIPLEEHEDSFRELAEDLRRGEPFHPFLHVKMYGERMMRVETLKLAKLLSLSKDEEKGEAWGIMEISFPPLPAIVDSPVKIDLHHTVEKPGR